MCPKPNLCHNMLIFLWLIPNLWLVAPSCRKESKRKHGCDKKLLGFPMAGASQRLTWFCTTLGWSCLGHQRGRVTPDSRFIFFLLCCAGGEAGSHLVAGQPLPVALCVCAI